MKSQLIYIELKTGYSDNGPAWIGTAEFSKTGQTVYIDNKALKKLKVPRPNSNHYDIETGDEYWVSGIKKNTEDRHWAGKGKVFINRADVAAYLDATSQQKLDLVKFEIVELRMTDKKRISEIENARIPGDQSGVSREYWDKNSKKFEL